MIRYKKKPIKQKYISYSIDPDFQGTCKESDIDLVKKVIVEVSDLMDIEPFELFIPCREPDIAHSRWTIWQIFWEKGYTLSECGGLFGKYNHTTVMHALVELPVQMEKEPMLKDVYAKVYSLINPEKAA